MNDTKNILLAWISSISTVFAAIEYRDVIAILSAVVLPAVFFTLGKAIDVAVQIYLNRRKFSNADQEDEADQNGSEKVTK